MIGLIQERIALKILNGFYILIIPPIGSIQTIHLTNYAKRMAASLDREAKVIATAKAVKA
jgi:hypothetical protein